MAFTGVIISSSFNFFFMMKLRDIARVISATKGEMTVVAEESYQNVRTVKAFSNED